MLYHREPLLPIDIELMLDHSSDDVEPIDDYIQAMLQVWDDLKPEAMRSIKRAQDYQKEYYDKRHTTQAFSSLQHRLHNNDVAFKQTLHRHFPVGAATWNGGTGAKQSSERKGG